jgi:Ca2+-binding RTX toxin-like protein
MARIDATFRPKLLDLAGTEGNDSLTGTGNHDDLFGLGGDDHLIGLEGDDQLHGGTGADTMEGGPGHDHYYVDNPADVVIEAAGEGIDNVHASASYALVIGSEVENLFAADPAGIAALDLAGNALDNLIYGTNGANFLRGGGGNDLILAGGGADLLDGEAGADRMFGGGGDDIYHVDNEGDSINELANQGTDRVRASVSYVLLGQGAHVEILEAAAPGGTERLDLAGGAGSQTISGNEGTNLLDGRGGDDLLQGFGGDDYLVGGEGADAMHGGAGNDTYYIGAGDAGDLVAELDGEGNDRIATLISYALAAGASIEVLEATNATAIDAMDLSGNELGNLVAGNDGVNHISGGGGDDMLGGYAGDDVLDGGDGNDLMNGGGGDDAMTGGIGNDTYYVDAAGDLVNEIAGEGNDRIAAFISYALAAGASIEILEAADPGAPDAMDLAGNEIANTINGNAGLNILYGQSGDDSLFGLGGDDYLVGGDGADAMSGGLGNDTYYIDDAGDTVTELAGEGTDRIATLISYIIPAGASIEVLEATNSTSTNVIDLHGNEIGNLVAGNDGVNNMTGGGGNDVLGGYGGNDVLGGGEGDDVLIGGDGNDFMIAAAGNDLIIGGSGNDILEGDGGDDVLDGGDGKDALLGGPGNDIMTGGGGDDDLVGTAGNDIYYVQDAGDLITDPAGQGNDRVATTISYTLAPAAEIELLETADPAGTTAINLTGNQFDQTVIGNEGVNLLDGKEGLDKLIGAGGADFFAFTTKIGAGNIDTIVDFSAADDTILLEDAEFVGLAVGALGSNTFVVGTKAQDADDRIIYDPATGALYFDADGSGAAAMVQFATLNGLPVITASDFVII